MPTLLSAPVILLPSELRLTRVARPHEAIRAREYLPAPRWISAIFRQAYSPRRGRQAHRACVAIY